MPEETPLIPRTLRTTAWILVPTLAFLTILSLVAIFAIPSSTPKTDGPTAEKVERADRSSSDPSRGVTPRTGGAAVKVQTKN